jgi:hypothetical protein
MLKPVDIAVLCALISWPPGQEWTQATVANMIGISQSNVHRALRQLERSGLWSGRAPRKTSVRELLAHGVRYVYPPELGPPTRGLPTAHAGPATSGQLVVPQPYVWPWEAGLAFGPALAPLHPCVPGAASTHPQFHELMAVVDVFRVGRAREVRIAEDWLNRKLGLDR